MGSTPSKQKDTVFAKPRTPSFQDMGSNVGNGELGMGEDEQVPSGRVPKTRFPDQEAEASVRKHQSRSPGSPVPFETISKVSEEIAVSGACKDQVPDYQAEPAFVSGGNRAQESDYIQHTSESDQKAGGAKQEDPEDTPGSEDSFIPGEEHFDATH